MKEICLCLIFLISACTKDTSTKPKVKFVENITTQNLRTDSNGLSFAEAKMRTVYGDVIFRFFTKAAPVTTSRIMELIQNKFYDGLVIHRMIPNFILQTGDPTGSGTGGSGLKLQQEISDLQHIKGTIGLAHGHDVNSGDSQFYICLTTLPHLDKKSTIFAQIVEGFDVLTKLSKGDRIIEITLDLKQ
jgi:cyclophilin family peptidyl-prolyl cis-trans isomerase